MTTSDERRKLSNGHFHHRLLAFRYRPWRRALQTLLALFGLVYALVLLLLVLGVAQNTVQALVQSFVQPNDREINTQAAFIQSQANLRAKNSFGLTYFAERAILNERRIQGHIRLFMPAEVKAGMRDFESKAPVADCADGHFCRLKSAYRAAEFKIEVEAFTVVGSIGTRTYVTVPLLELFSDTPALQTDGEVIRPLDLPIATFPELYPNDTYSVSFLMAIYNPGFEYIDTNLKQSVTWNYLFDSSLTSPGLKPLSVAQNLRNTYQITYRRDDAAVRYVYVVASVPFVFAAVFAHLLLSRQETTLIEFLPALAAAILAVLPLRSVLVPPEVEGLTRVDLVLGTGLVVLVCVGVAKYFQQVAGDVLRELRRNSAPRISKSG